MSAADLYRPLTALISLDQGSAEQGSSFALKLRRARH